MQEQNTTDVSGKAAKTISSFADFFSGKEQLELVKNAGFAEPSRAFSVAAPLIAANKNVLIEYAEDADRAALYALPLMNSDSGELAIVFSGTETAAGNIADLFEKLSLQAVVLSAGQPLPKEAAAGVKAIVGTPAAITEFSNSGQWPEKTKIASIIIDGLDNAPTALHSEATSAELIGAFLEKRVDKSACQFIWAAASEPLIFRALLNTYFRENNAESLCLDLEEDAHVQHLYVEVGSDLTAKPNALCDLLEAYGLPTSVIFCSKPSDADLVDVMLRKRGIKAYKLIGHVPGSKVASAISDVLEGDATALVVTDISSRGVAIEDFEMVINHSIDSDPEVYIHRTGHPGSDKPLKRVVSIVGPTDLAHFHYIKKLFEFEFQAAELPSETDLIKGKIARLAEDSPQGYVKERYLELAPLVLEAGNKDEIVALLLYNTLEALPESRSRGGHGRNRDRDNDRNDRDRENRRGDRDNRRGRGSRDDGSEERDDREAQDRGRRREQAPPKKDVRFYIGHGSDAGFSEERLKKLLETAEDSNAPVNPERISVRSHYTFVDFPEEVSEKILKQLEGAEIETGKPLVVYKATMISTPRKEEPEQESARTGKNSEQAAGDANGNGHSREESGSQEEGLDKIASAAAE